MRSIAQAITTSNLRWPMRLRPAHPRIIERLDDLPTSRLRYFRERCDLVLYRLPIGAHPNVKPCSLGHGMPDWSMDRSLI